MKITVFTSNQPRHIALINKLASIGKTTYAIIESSTMLPGAAQDCLNKSKVMTSYFSNVISAEKKIFGGTSFLRGNIHALSLKYGELSFIDRNQIEEALDSDLFVVFGASYIRGWLLDYLLDSHAINIHMGLSPYYRGTSCNFWSLYDYKPEYVGATIHLLSKGLDNGPILYHALPTLNNFNAFEYTMYAVESAQLSLVEMILKQQLKTMVPVPQDKNLQIRYSKDAEFTEEIASEFLSRNFGNIEIKNHLTSSIMPKLIRPYFS
jgi:folate-dependent phosphoribosylglycinamide formyltransferase PurN